MIGPRFLVKNLLKDGEINRPNYIETNFLQRSEYKK